MTICVGSVSKVDVIKHRMLPLPSRFGVCVEHDWIMFTAKRLFKENNGYSVYLNNTFNGLAPKMNLDRSDTHVHAKKI